MTRALQPGDTIQAGINYAKVGHIGYDSVIMTDGSRLSKENLSQLLEIPLCVVFREDRRLERVRVEK